MTQLSKYWTYWNFTS